MLTPTLTIHVPSLPFLTGRQTATPRHVLCSYQRFHDHPQVQLLESRALELYHKLLPPATPDRCGALKWPAYVIISDRVVFPDGVRPGAGKCLAEVDRQGGRQERNAKRRLYPGATLVFRPSRRQ